MWRGSKLPCHCHPLREADTISCGNRFDWKFERAAALSSSPSGAFKEAYKKQNERPKICPAIVLLFLYGLSPLAQRLSGQGKQRVQGD